jgi:hypothetical protein
MYLVLWLDDIAVWKDSQSEHYPISTVFSLENCGINYKTCTRIIANRNTIQYLQCSHWTIVEFKYEYETPT